MTKAEIVNEIAAKTGLEKQVVLTVAEDGNIRFLPAKILQKM